MKLNLKAKNEGKKHLGFQIYESDFDALHAYADENGVTVSVVARSLINDFLDTVNPEQTATQSN